jgi:hypothetical protein
VCEKFEILRTVLRYETKGEGGSLRAAARDYQSLLVWEDLYAGTEYTVTQDSDALDPETESWRR